MNGIEAFVTDDIIYRLSKPQDFDATLLVRYSGRVKFQLIKYLLATATQMHIEDKYKSLKDSSLFTDVKGNTLSGLIVPLAQVSDLAASINSSILITYKKAERFGDRYLYVSKKPVTLNIINDKIRVFRFQLIINRGRTRLDIGRYFKENVSVDGNVVLKDKVKVQYSINVPDYTGAISLIISVLKCRIHITFVYISNITNKIEHESCETPFEYDGRFRLVIPKFSEDEWDIVRLVWPNIEQSPYIKSICSDLDPTTKDIMRARNAMLRGVMIKHSVNMILDIEKAIATPELLSEQIIVNESQTNDIINSIMTKSLNSVHALSTPYIIDSTGSILLRISDLSNLNLEVSTPLMTNYIVIDEVKRNVNTNVGYKIFDRTNVVNAINNLPIVIRSTLRSQDKTDQSVGKETNGTSLSAVENTKPICKLLCRITDNANIISANVNIQNKLKHEIIRELAFSSSSISGDIQAHIELKLKLTNISLELHIIGDWLLPPKNFTIDVAPKFNNFKWHGVTYVAENVMKHRVTELTLVNLNRQYVMTLTYVFKPEIYETTITNVQALTVPPTIVWDLSTVGKTTQNSYRSGGVTIGKFKNLKLVTSRVQPWYTIVFSDNIEVAEVESFRLSTITNFSQVKISGTFPSMGGSSVNIISENLSLLNLMNLATRNYNSIVRLNNEVVALNIHMKNLETAFKEISQPSFGNGIASLLGTAGMVAQVFNPVLGATLLAASAVTTFILKVANDSKPIDVLTSAVNVISFTCFAFTAAGVSLSNIDVTKFTDSIKTLNVDKLEITDAIKLGKLNPVLYWEYALRKVQRNTNSVDDIVHNNVMGSVEIITHRYLPFNNHKISKAADTLQSESPIIYGALRKMNLAPEHAKVWIERVTPSVSGLRRQIDIFGVADFSSLDINEPNVIDSKLKRSLQIGSIRVASEMNNDGDITIIPFTELGYNEQDVMSLVGDLPELEHLIDAGVTYNHLWTAASELILSRQYMVNRSEVTANATQIPIPTNALLDGLHSYIKSNAHRIQYNLLTNNCQTVANGIRDFISKGEKPSWLTSKTYLKICGDYIASIQK